MFLNASSVYDINTLFYAQYFFKVVTPYFGRSMYLCISSLLHPYSRGTVTLQSTDPYDPPVIDPNYFEDPRDLHDIVQGKVDHIYCEFQSIVLLLHLLAVALPSKLPGPIS